MTRKDYQIIAEAINAVRSTAEQKTLVGSTTWVTDYMCNSLARELAEQFALDNPRFDRDHFLSACGVNS